MKLFLKGFKFTVTWNKKKFRMVCDPEYVEKISR